MRKTNALQNLEPGKIMDVRNSIRSRTPLSRCSRARAWQFLKSAAAELGKRPEIGDGAQQVAGLSESGACPPRFAVRSLVLPTGVTGAYSHLAADVIIVELDPVAGACIPFATRNEIKFFDCQFARLRNSCRPHGSSPSLFKAYGGFRSLLPISPETTRGAVMRVTFRSLRKSDDLAACAAIDPWPVSALCPSLPSQQLRKLQQRPRAPSPLPATD